ncbi:RAMP superfamily CRISPR-associated protein [soil metagenome]
MSDQARASQIEHWTKNRAIRKRIVITGELCLLSPASFGNGDAEGVTEIPLLRDPLKGVALLTGTSIAGALRNYLWEMEMGYATPADPKKISHKKSYTALLFGGLKGDADGEQSALIIDDALGEPPQTELRDGVAIDPITRTAADDQKYDMELLRAGTKFPLRFELLINAAEKTEKEDVERTQVREDKLRAGLARALAGLQQPGEIHLGMRKRRGLGECQVTEWSIEEYDLTTANGLSAWLHGAGERRHADDIVKLLCAPASTQTVYAAVNDQREWFHLHAYFAIESSMLIRSGTGVIDNGPDAMHIHRLEFGTDKRQPVLPGTSVAGALRSRILRIAQTLHAKKGVTLVEQLFGSDHKASGGRKYAGSRIAVRETVIDPTDTRSFVQNRIRIDRFTGGVLDNYLFDEVPLFGGPQSQVELEVHLRSPERAHIGLLLLALKDLWLADLSLGGGANVGRGRLRGVWATLTQQENNRNRTWVFHQPWDGRQHGALTIEGEPSTELEKYVHALNHWTPEISPSKIQQKEEVTHAASDPTN